MSRYLRYTLLTLLWVAVAAYIVFAASAVRRVRRTGTVGRLEIEVVDSSSQGHLVSAAMVRQWISHAGIKTLGTAVDAVDLTGIERLIARNGFVDKTVAYVSYGGTLHIEISQRKPLVRLLTDGMNAYVTADGDEPEALRCRVCRRLCLRRAPRLVALRAGGHRQLPSSLPCVVRRERAGAYRPASRRD